MSHQLNKPSIILFRSFQTTLSDRVPSILFFIPDRTPTGGNSLQNLFRFSAWPPTFNRQHQPHISTAIPLNTSRITPISPASYSDNHSLFYLIWKIDVEISAKNSPKHRLHTPRLSYISPSHLLMCFGCAGWSVIKSLLRNSMYNNENEVNVEKRCK